MKSSELNKMLIEYLPELYSKYLDEVSWQEGDDTGSHIVYGDVLTPHLIECILQKETKEIIKIYAFLESVLSLEDEYSDEVIAFSVLESIVYFIKEDMSSIDLLGPRSRKWFEDLVL